MASAGSALSGSSFLAAVSAVYNYAYLSSTTVAAATASLSSGATTAAAYSAATSPAAVSTSVAAIDVRRINAALYCAYLASATNSSNITASNGYGSLCLAPAPTPASADVVQDFSWIAGPCAAGVLVVGGILTVLYFASGKRRRYGSEVSPGKEVDDRESLGTDKVVITN